MPLAEIRCVWQLQNQSEWKVSKLDMVSRAGPIDTGTISIDVLESQISFRKQSSGSFLCIGVIISELPTQWAAFRCNLSIKRLAKGSALNQYGLTNACCGYNIAKNATRTTRNGILRICYPEIARNGLPQGFPYLVCVLTFPRFRLWSFVIWVEMR